MSLRDSPFSDVKVPLAWTAALSLVVLLVVGVALLVSDRRETFQEQAYGATRSTLDSIQAPVSNIVAKPVRWTEAGIGGIKGYFFAVSQNRELRKENIEMRRWRDAALSLQDQNERLRALLLLKTDPPVPMVTGRAVTDSRGPFSNARLINVGRERGVQIGNPVMSENGLVGRVVGATNGASRVLLVTDVASRTPVMVDRTNARAILTGDGGPHPELAYLRGQAPVKVGDRIVTSGDGGVFPRGLPVGVAIKGIDGRWRVQLASDYAPIDFVRVLLYRDFEQLVDQQALARSQMPPAPPGLNAPPPPMAGVVAPPAPGASNAPGAAAPAAPAGAVVPATRPPSAPTPAPKTPAPSTPAPKTPATKTPAPKAPAPKAPAQKAPAPPIGVTPDGIDALLERPDQ